jgi:Spy/CpxP family protein refolding chaperone
MTMIYKTVISFAAAVACAAALAASPAATSAAAPDMSGGWSAQRNVLQSQRYDRLLETNRAFRQAQMRKECGPIRDAQLHQDCLASFSQDTPYVGSSTPRRHYRSDYGR